MQPIYTVKNQYLGINAHLHSHWHQTGGWGGFHTPHIGHLASTLKARLLPLGYTTDVESSLQIRRDDDKRSVTRADIAIYPVGDRSGGNRYVSSQTPAAITPLPSVLTSNDLATSIMIRDIPEMLDEPALSEKPYKAVAIYRSRKDRYPGEKPVAWVELLSPANKGSGSDAESYYLKRQALIEQGIIVVELDYLHEEPPTLSRLADYTLPNGEAGQAHPYRIIIFHPRPDWYQGKVFIYEFDVDAPIPTVAIPLLKQDSLDFDFGLPYRKTFEEMLYGWEFVDYTQLPARFNRYHRRDQARIANRMVAVINAARQGLDLESGPFPVTPLPLEQALALLSHHFPQ